MTTLEPGARQLPFHHVTIRAPWQDTGWTGVVCARPLANTSCLILPRISQARKDDVEEAAAGNRLDELQGEYRPPCIAERVSFMAPFELVRTMRHPYAENNPETHGHFAATRFVQPPYSAACVPFRWMLRGEVEGNPKESSQGLAESMRLGWVTDREPSLPFTTSWVQERGNQRVLLDTFFSALRPQESLCFFYAKRTPLSEQARRVILGVGRVLSVGEPTEYEYSVASPPLQSALWERNIGHSIRPGFLDGFLFPYQEVLALGEQDGSLNPEEFVAFAPDEYFDAYSYGSELLTHDGAVASLVTCAAALHQIRARVDGPWDAVLGWVDNQLNRLWKARGAFPGLGSALSAFGFEWGFQHGSLLAYEIELVREREGGDKGAWEHVDAVMDEPATLGGPIAELLPASMCKGWKRIGTERRALLELLSRCSLSGEQALRLYDRTQRADARIDASDGELLANPYLFFERDRRSAEPIAFGAVDRGLFPDESIRRAHPLASPSLVEDPADPRRVRALVTDILEDAASEGHTILPRDWLIRSARERSLQPPCPLGEDVLAASDASFLPVVARTATRAGEPAYQVDRLVECRDIIRREVLARRKGRPHEAALDWRSLVDQGLGASLPPGSEERELEVRARAEKASALEEVFRSRLSVLLGPAGTGKTTLMRMLCALPEVAGPGILLLAPTGKARVRLEELTGQRGKGRTIAQFLIGYHRYDGSTGTYFPNRSAPRCTEYRTVVLDESSMLTEDQLAEVFDALSGVERYVLVGDPRQLPPIGPGRPFVDIVRELAPDGLEAVFPRVGPGYAELTIPRRQAAGVSVDVLLAAHFSGRALDPGADEVWELVQAQTDERLRMVQWSDSHDLHAKLIEELTSALKLEGKEDELGFELALGGARYKDLDRAFFANRFKDNPGAGSKVEAWQILSPLRAGQEGVDAANRMIQERFRRRWKEMAVVEGWARKVTRPFGPQSILYGDKVINTVNQRRFDVWPKLEGEGYIANGDLGVVVGQYKGSNWKLKGLPWKLEVEFAGQLGHKFGFSKAEFGDEAANPLELAYALTVHKTQGSEFGITFVILPNPCWLLSRELLYTALTRHRQRLVILHQGPFLDFRRYASEEHSEISRRMTNLLTDPLPRPVHLGLQIRFLEDGLIHRTERGELVRSKSELVIADKLHARGVDYAYERPLILGEGRVRFPDFTIADDARGVTFYWEHLGLMDDPSYRSRWERKRAEYQRFGILPWNDGGGKKGTLIETRDDPGGALDAGRIAKLIEDVLMA